jgi:hypothetical protein
VVYPLKPKSTTSLRPGQFWAVPLASGRFACGRVLQTNAATLPSKTRGFFGGLHDWVGAAPPSGSEIAGTAIVAFGVMHIKSITMTGGAILGERPLEADAIELPRLLSGHGGPGTMVLLGVAPIREASQKEWGTLPVLGYWGYDFIQQLAEQRFSGRVA